MHIGIEASTIAENNLTGIGKIVLNLIKRLVNYNVRITLFYDQKPAASWFRNNDLIREVIIPVTKKLFPLYEQVFLPRAICKSGIDIYHAPANSAVPYFCKTPIVVTIHDVIPIIGKGVEFFGDSMKGLFYLSYMKHSIRNSARRSKIIITDSNASKNDIISYLHAPENKIRVVYSGIDVPSFNVYPISEIKQKYGINKKYFIYAGGFAKRKNIERILLAYKKVRGKYNMQLVLMGDKSNPYFPHVRRFFDKLAFEKNEVIFPGYLPDDEFHSLIKNSEALIYPSLYEGFGVPPLEAMECGCPVIISNIPPLKETCKGAAIFVNPLNVCDIASAMENILNNLELKNELIKKGKKRSDFFSWEKMSKGVFSIYKEIYYGSSH